MGSASLYFELAPRSGILADINSELVEAFQVVKDNPAAVSESLNRYPLGEETYYSLRDLNPKTLDRLDRTARFIYLNRFCFNGLYRTNKKGWFNVPYSPRKTGPLPPLIHLISVAKVLRRARIVCADFEDTLDQTRPGDFAYIDPPYALRRRRVFREYAANGFSAADLGRLREALR